MPELPELEVVAEVLCRRVIGQSITALEVSKADGPLVLRDLTHGDFVQSLIGMTFASVSRRGKFLIFPLAPVPPASHPGGSAPTGDIATAPSASPAVRAAASAAVPGGSQGVATAAAGAVPSAVRPGGGCNRAPSWWPRVGRGAT